MNWLGEIIKHHISKNDIVLDLGCGIMQATNDTISKGKIKCKTILGVELVPKYLDRIKDQYPTIKTNVLDTKLFIDNSFDVVLCLDVLEHLKLSDAVFVLNEMKRISRKKVIIYTPLEYKPNDQPENGAWGMGENVLQKHQCLITTNLLHDLKFKTQITKIDNNILGVYEK